MKKSYFLLLIILFLFPIITYAEEDWAETIPYEYAECVSSSVNDYYTEATYENGHYILNGNIYSSASSIFRNNENIEVVYQCYRRYVTEENDCEQIIAVIRNSSCISSTSETRYNVRFIYKNGDTYETNKQFYIGNDYTYENGIYTLKNYTAYDISTISKESYLSENYKGKYICEPNTKTSCTKLYRIETRGNTNVGGFYHSKVLNVENYYLVSDTYKKINNEFVLISPKRVYPATDTGEVGYTCRSREDKCEQLYKIEVTDYYDSHDGGRRSYVDLLTIETKSENKTLLLKQSFDVSEFFNAEELRNTISTNSDIAEIKDNKLVLYKIGTTDIIYEDDFNYKVLHLEVVDETIGNNPKTTTSYIIVVIIGLLTVLSLVINKKKLKN